uniref:Uncharacterized protein n=1 Tax=Chromera velia CCMP2878 TaxID=1169474 RepID=A0A0G4HMM1_9ALVE|eukprot:Cvel_7574.t1-p1 / transcript=Cvel_7574.t1 / gene=Cvel_7574 / organism=Chromera_velia_CCMP2878 / gene_product=Ankyrin repeat domain-containing protein 50, putative / transcript_product=Ankyrin repeat domain-containing protein 50, putative / location=Cvel_scaffold399:4498-6069(-) / protein_length=524 / sequence_SO=supercontig / SO=protein_coding / is_pseudo=false
MGGSSSSARTDSHRPSHGSLTEGLTQSWNCLINGFREPEIVVRRRPLPLEEPKFSLTPLILRRVRKFQPVSAQSLRLAVKERYHFVSIDLLFLLQLGADVNGLVVNPDKKAVQKNLKESALHLAAEMGNVACVNTLLHFGAHPNVRDTTRETALMRASSRGFSEVVAALLSVQTVRRRPVTVDVNAAGALGGETALLYAAKNGSVLVVRLLLLVNAQVNLRDNYGWTALMEAALHNHLDVLNTLIDARADVNGLVVNPDKKAVQKNLKESALHLAAEMGNVACVNTLLHFGAHPNVRDTIGETALMRASSRGFTEVVAALLSVQTVRRRPVTVDVNAAGALGGETALLYAAKNGSVLAVRLLLLVNAQVNLRDNYGWTALMEAALHNHLDVLNILIDARADVNAADSEGRSAALHLASEKGLTRVVETLLKADAKVDLENRDGWTTLMYTSKNGKAEVVKLLVDAHANVNTRSRDGWSSLRFAESNGHSEIVKTLVRSPSWRQKRMTTMRECEGSLRTAIDQRR